MCDSGRRDCVHWDLSYWVAGVCLGVRDTSSRGHSSGWGQRYRCRTDTGGVRDRFSEGRVGLSDTPDLESPFLQPPSGVTPPDIPTPSSRRQVVVTCKPDGPCRSTDSDRTKLFINDMGSGTRLGTRSSDYRQVLPTSDLEEP